ncbi:hypothetical protein ABZ848_07090 [Streptomyces sp. NPDC047081]|uniref:effector-associated constant component EACC1 n=1 Tax=Streptomyces sp. NPDC047081 TaxID=3154706 RepID=UPI00340570D2
MEGAYAESELRSFRTWLSETPEIRRHAQLSWVAPVPKPGEMGSGTVEALQLVTDNLWQVAAFALAYATWRKTRRRTPTVTIEHDGTTLVIEGHDEASVVRITRALTPSQERRDSA